jgi:hypothetical protein
MAKVPLIPTWMKQQYEMWEPPVGPEGLPLTEEETIEMAEVLAMEWNGQLIPFEVLQRQVRNGFRRERRRRRKEEAEARAREARASGLPEPVVEVKPRRPLTKPRRTRRRIEIGRPQLGVITPPKRSRRSPQAQAPD